MNNKIARVSALVYTALSLGFSAIFVVATYLTGEDYPPVARWGGSIWVFVLALIITMPIVIPYIKKRYEK
ncbi:MAG: hypothetical protein ACYC56_08910 [Candidatus Aquicultor sp.]